MPDQNNAPERIWIKPCDPCENPYDYYVCDPRYLDGRETSYVKSIVSCAEIERLTKERDEAIIAAASWESAARLLEAERDEARAMLADAERDMRQRAADSCLGLMTAQSARKFILALPLKHADRENDAALAQGQKEGE